MFSRGDLSLVRQMMKAFNKFSEAAGLQANPAKSSIYFGGVASNVQDMILQEFGLVKEVWRKITKWCGHPRQAYEWEKEKRYMITQARTKSNKQMMYRLVFSIAIYQLWQERNKRKFKGIEMGSEQVIRSSQIQIAINCQGHQGLLQMIAA
ncbi:hypothetical protein C2S51_000517 [Perilla frutescens var. frutescens]|nr:hypothetical protein C2S51_000517 [Perilla frutescens var. frutescens]